ncbi:MAG: NAD(P)/FAD-dependent oxidoreductase, partial [Candidatus Bipolaricaulia bacterium]
GRILLIDRADIGAHQTSTCGAPYALIQEIGCEAAVLQVLDTMRFEMANERVDVKLVRPYCTLDYRKFCKLLFAKTQADSLRAGVIALEGRTVITNAGRFTGKCIVDCTGGRAVLASSLRPDFVDSNSLAFGLETVADYRDDRIHFYLDEQLIPQGVFWIFPIGDRSRIGVASYAGETRIKENLETFLDRLGVGLGDEMHGGFIPYGLRRPVVGEIFLVGDSAGQALPLSAEGIWPSLKFGRRCGAIIQKIIDGKMGLEAGLKEYERYVMEKRLHYDRLLHGQGLLISSSEPVRAVLVKSLKNRGLVQHVQREYISILP